MKQILIRVMYITMPSAEQAQDLAKSLLERQLIACANIINATSLYEEEEQLKQTPECILIVKTSEEMYRAASDLIEKFHPYDIPCIASWPVEVNRSYADWVAERVADNG